MPRLNEILKELKVGLNTVTEVQKNKGKPLEEATFYTKITDEQYPCSWMRSATTRNRLLLER